jgi:hypothetical protein
MYWFEPMRIEFHEAIDAMNGNTDIDLVVRKCDTGHIYTREPVYNRLLTNCYCGVFTRSYGR